MTMTDTMLAGPAGTLRVVVTGSGDATPVLFAHSFAGSSAQWAPQLDHANAARRAVALDFHGHGRSEARPRAPFDVPSFAADIDAAANQLDLPRFVLVGHSLGGAAAIAYAGDHPERVAGLALVATPGRLPVEQVAGIVDALDKDYDVTMAGIWRRLLADATPATRRTVEGESDRIPEKIAREIIRATFEFDPVPPLTAYAGPRLTVSTPQEGPGQALHELVPGVDHETVDGTSHWIQLDEPDRFNEILDGFLERVDRAEARSAVGAATV
jgi:pyruvate dehydrogenase E2 component (dihydrolipoamide acetyltransferase)